jgi:hypothetical protein
MRVGIHVSDLLGCKRASCLHPDEDVIGERQIAFFYNGIERHRLIQELLGEDWQCEKEFVFKDGGISIISHPDAVYNGSDSRDVTLEIKTTTRTVKSPFSNHVAQIKSYIAILSAL